MRLGIIGSREYAPTEAVREYVRALPKDTIIVTGGWPSRVGPYHVVEATRGVDRVAYKEAEAAGLVTVLVSGSRAAHGRHAGIQRNPTTVALSEALVAFWDLQSTGTRGTLRMALEAPHLRGRIRVFGPGGGEVSLDAIRGG